jgi:hypothetical protein
MRPQNEFSEDRAAELCLLQMAIETTEQLPKFWEALKRRPGDYCAADPEQVAILDLYLLVWFWGYLRSEDYFAPLVGEHVSPTSFRSRLRQLPFDSYRTIFVRVRFDEELLDAA